LEKGNLRYQVAQYNDKKAVILFAVSYGCETVPYLEEVLPIPSV